MEEWEVVEEKNDEEGRRWRRKGWGLYELVRQCRVGVGVVRD